MLMFLCSMCRHYKLMKPGSPDLFGQADAVVKHVLEGHDRYPFSHCQAVCLVIHWSHGLQSYTFLGLPHKCFPPGEWTGPISTRACPSSSAEQTTGRSSCGGWTITRWVFTAVCQVFWLIWFATSAFLYNRLLGQNLTLSSLCQSGGLGAAHSALGKGDVSVARLHPNIEIRLNTGILGCQIFTEVVRKEHFSSRLTTYRLLASHLSLLFFNVWAFLLGREVLLGSNLIVYL